MNKIRKVEKFYVVLEKDKIFVFDTESKNIFKEEYYPVDDKKIMKAMFKKFVSDFKLSLKEVHDEGEEMFNEESLVPESLLKEKEEKQRELELKQKELEEKLKEASGMGVDIHEIKKNLL